eukprot:1156176-Pelagomonas_calceolata.AAC.2
MTTPELLSTSLPHLHTPVILAAPPVPHTPVLCPTPLLCHTHLSTRLSTHLLLTHLSWQAHVRCDRFYPGRQLLGLLAATHDLAASSAFPDVRSGSAARSSLQHCLLFSRAHLRTRSSPRRRPLHPAPPAPAAAAAAETGESAAAAAAAAAVYAQSLQTPFEVAQIDPPALAARRPQAVRAMSAWA